MQRRAGASTAAASTAASAAATAVTETALFLRILPRRLIALVLSLLPLPELARVVRVGRELRGIVENAAEIALRENFPRAVKVLGGSLGTSVHKERPAWQWKLWEAERVQAGIRSFLKWRALGQEERKRQTKLFCQAVADQKLDKVRGLLSNGVNVNAQAPVEFADAVWSDTPLGHSVSVGNLALVRLLIRNGATVDEYAVYGSTPLHGAAQQGNLPVVKYLIECGANPSLRSVSLNFANGEKEEGRNAWGWTIGGINPAYDGSDVKRKAVVAFLGESPVDESSETCERLRFRRTDWESLLFNGEKESI